MENRDGGRLIRKSQLVYPFDFTDEEFEEMIRNDPDEKEEKDREGRQPFVAWLTQKRRNEKKALLQQQIEKKKTELTARSHLRTPVRAEATPGFDHVVTSPSQAVSQVKLLPADHEEICSRFENDWKTNVNPALSRMVASYRNSKRL